MQRALLTGLVALVGVMILSEDAEARRFGRRRGSSNCSTCNNCQAPVQGQYDPNMGPGGPQYGPNNAPPPAPNAQSYYGPNGNQGSTTFYRGQPQLAPNAQGNANVQGNLNQGGAQAGANLNTRQGNANIQGNAGANLNTPSGNANIQGNTGANLNRNNSSGGANAGASGNLNLND